MYSRDIPDAERTIMSLLGSSRARALLRAYPFKAGQSELKKILKAVVGEHIEPIEIVPGLQLALEGLRNNSRVFWWYEEIEAPLQYFLVHYLPFEGLMIDCGAATGLIGLLAARRKSCRVVMIEANQRVAEQLRITLEINPHLAPLCDLIAKPCALERDTRFDGMECVTLADVIKGHLEERGPVDFLKIDVDGPDVEVLKSSGEYLRRDFLRAVFIEIPPSHEEGFEIMQSRGYRAFAARKTHLPDLRRRGFSLVERDCFVRLEGPVKEVSPCENILWLDPDLPAFHHLNKWCLTHAEVYGF
jgi:hypothetical protein